MNLQADFGATHSPADLCAQPLCPPSKSAQAAIRDPCGALVLFNYPNFFRQIPPTDSTGTPLPDVIDMAVLDIHRDRARGKLAESDGHGGVLSVV